MTLKSRLSHRLGLVLGLLLATTAASQKSTLGSGRWEDPDLWHPPGIPASHEDVIVQSGHRVTVTGRKEVHSLTVQAEAGLFGEAWGGDVWIQVSGKIENHGYIAGGRGVSSPEQDLPGGHVILAGDGNADNLGTILGGSGDVDAYGGMVRIHIQGDFKNHPGGRIYGGAGGGITNPSGGEGGMVDIIAFGALENHGLIQGGAGAASDSFLCGPGGFVYLEGKLSAFNTGAIHGGPGGACGAGICGRNGPVMVVGRFVMMEGRAATLMGSTLTVQAEGGPISLHDLSAGAIQAQNGPLIFIAGGNLNLTSNAALTVQRMFAGPHVLVLADSVLMDPGVRLENLIAPTPIIRKRVRVAARTAPRLGQRFDQEIFSPDDASLPYHAATALSNRFGLILDGFGVMPVDKDPLFHMSVRGLPPFLNYIGTLDRTGRSTLTIRIPPAASLMGVDLYTTALVIDPLGGPRNVAPASVVTLR